MMTKVLILLFTICSVFQASSQDIEPIEIADNTFKIGGIGEENFYYGFAEGDKIIFSFEETNGKELKEIEVVELPDNSKFMEFKTTEVNNKELIIQNTGIYKFRFNNSSLGGRVCKIKIHRVPVSEETISFNTTVQWEKQPDTTFYDVMEDYLISKDTVVHNLVEQVSKVHSITNMDGNKTAVHFSLPTNTVAWSYYIGVDQAGQAALESASLELAEFASPIMARIPGYGPLAALALGGVPYIHQLQKGEDIDFILYTNENYNLLRLNQLHYYIKKGKVINDYSQMLQPLTGGLVFVLSNDNAVTGVSVLVKVTAITIIENWGKRSVQKFIVVPKKIPVLKN